MTARHHMEIGLCSRITAALELQGTKPSAKWELSVTDKMITMLIHYKPELLEEIKKEMKKHIASHYDELYIKPTPTEK